MRKFKVALSGKLEMRHANLLCDVIQKPKSKDLGL